jgi:hypothetical protein
LNIGKKGRNQKQLKNQTTSEEAINEVSGNQNSNFIFATGENQYHEFDVEHSTTHLSSHHCNNPF